ncbi:recombinase family protein [Enterocloster clostridioformis]|uniref:recombinase family protein n=1 Tax=Enterocloster clostridioformis TaxID=1531 RepID=UPI001314B70E|nr:recombinase family protein [Enterocloster clostridioformis]
MKFRRGEYQSKLCSYGDRKGGYKPNEIVKALFERNIPASAEYKAACGFNGHDISRCCRIWPTSSMVHILDDERYTGTYIMGKREVTEVGGHRVRMKDESHFLLSVHRGQRICPLPRPDGHRGGTGAGGSRGWWPDGWTGRHADRPGVCLSE